MNLRVRPVRRLRGVVSVPGDKSISHRAALFAALAHGSSDISGFLEAEDCLATLGAVQALGAEVSQKGPGHFRVTGGGLRGLQEPAEVIDCGNSGTTARLLLGLLAAQPFWTILTGDASLRSRPMARVADPLRRMGATVVGRAEGRRLPLAVRGAERVQAIEFDSPVASAQVKSAILLAGLAADGPVTVREPAPSRDHSERMLRLFGARVSGVPGTVTLLPGELSAAVVEVPGDISSAAFVLVAGLLVADAEVRVTGVGLNPTRTGLLDVLDAMGARLERETSGDALAEPAGSVTARTATLAGTLVAGRLVPRLIDEVPALAIAAVAATGVTEIRDARELRVKESDRIAALTRELARMGVGIEEYQDGMLIRGGQRLSGARVRSGGDHRIAMALTVAGLVADGETVVEDVDCIGTSFPTFPDILNALAGGEAVVVER